MIESLESRRLYSASTATSPKTIHEVAGTAFTADLGKALPVTLSPVAASTAANTTTFVTQAIIHWGDGTTSAGTIVSKSKGTAVIDGTHTYAKTGRYHIVVYVSRSASGTGPQPQFIELYRTLRDVAEVSAAS